MSLLYRIAHITPLLLLWRLRCSSSGGLLLLEPGNGRLLHRLHRLDQLLLLLLLLGGGSIGLLVRQWRRRQLLLLLLLLLLLHTA